ncbi:hypothetical protein REPUB_Repub01dG0022700 [Reevesia pubescens]
MSCYSLNFIFILVLFLFLFLQPSTQTLPRTSPRNHPNHQVHRQQNSKFSNCDSFSRAEQRSLCDQLHRIHNFQPLLPSSLPPPPPSKLNEIDPRYGVEKRLVPSGPNPLHN